MLVACSSSGGLPGAVATCRNRCEVSPETGHHADPGEAAAAWNRRAPVPSSYEQGRLAGLEEAAKFCLEMERTSLRADRKASLHSLALGQAAAAVRALASRPAQPAPGTDDVGYEHPQPVKCPDCGGKLRDSGPNTQGTLRFLDCQGTCGCCWYVDGQAGTGEPERNWQQERAAAVAWLRLSAASYREDADAVDRDHPEETKVSAVLRDMAYADELSADLIERGDHISDQAQRSGGERG